MAGFGPPLDLSGLQYGPSAVRAQPQTAGWYDRPRKAGDRPVEASSCTVLTRLPEVVFDVNGYYRALGFRFPYEGITRAALREHYAAVGGPDDPYLTQVFQLLIDAAERAAYDRAPFGEMHLDRIQARLVEERVKRQAAIRNPGPHVRATQDEILQEMGLESNGDDTVNHYPGADDRLLDPVQDEALDQRPWPWGYYQWSSGCPDTGRLKRLQAMLVAELAAREASVRFAVGYCGRSRTDSRFVVHRNYGVDTVYLREDHEPDGELAAAAADVLLDN